MSLNEYLTHLSGALSSLHDFGVADLVEFNSELREGQRCLVTAQVLFVDGSIFT
jgi:predicted component of type VI protein secretion system